MEANLKQKLMSSSAKAVKTCIKFGTNDLSFVRVHEMYNRATPEKFLLYKHALNLFKLKYLLNGVGVIEFQPNFNLKTNNIYGRKK